MIIKHITKYVKGEMSEEEALELWVHLVRHPEDLARLKTYLMYRRNTEEGEGSHGNTE